MRFLLFLLLLPLAAGAAVFRWVDKDGKVHYSDTRPSPETGKVEEKSLHANVIDTAGQPYAVQKASKEFPVTLYSSADCGPACGAGRELLKKRGVPFTEVPLTTEEAQAALRKRAGEGPLMVPSLFVGSQVLRGFEEGIWNRQLDDAGYPRNASPSAKKPESPDGAVPKK